MLQQRRGSSVDRSEYIHDKDNGDNAGRGWAHMVALAHNLSIEEIETGGSGVQGSLELQQWVQDSLKKTKPKTNNEGSNVRKHPYDAFTRLILLFPGKETEAREC